MKRFDIDPQNGAFKGMQSAVLALNVNHPKRLELNKRTLEAIKADPASLHWIDWSGCGDIKQIPDKGRCGCFFGADIIVNERLADWRGKVE